MRRLFRIHRRQPEKPGQEERQELVKAGEKLRRTMINAPPESEAQNLAKRFRDRGDDYLRFIPHPEIEPTNNSAEQVIRQVVIARASSRGTRSPNGRVYKKRLWTVLADL